jgi:hypothetical protein
MGIILYFVFRSLAKHLRKLNEAARLEASRSDAEVAGTGVAGAGAGTAETGAGSRREPS